MYFKFIINSYASTEDKENYTEETFYEELDRICDIIPNHCVKIILGDFNAKVGKEVRIYRPMIGRDSFHDISNNNGISLINFCD